MAEPQYQDRPVVILVCSWIAIAVAVAFFVLAFLFHRPDPADVYGGRAWVLGIVFLVGGVGGLVSRGIARWRRARSDDTERG
jgi:hypothetical protein